MAGSSRSSKRRESSTTRSVRGVPVHLPRWGVDRLYLDGRGNASRAGVVPVAGLGQALSRRRSRPLEGRREWTGAQVVPERAGAVLPVGGSAGVDGGRDR